MRSSFIAAAFSAAVLTAGAPVLTPYHAALRAQDAPPAAEEPRRVPLFTWRDAALLGAFAGSAILIAPLDKELAGRLQDSTVQANRFFRNSAVVVRDIATPGSVVIGLGLYGFGRLTKNEKVADLGFHGLEALAIGEGVALLMKGAFGRARPFVDVDNPHDFQLGRGFRGKTDYRSFPSGHTIAAFAAAAAVTSEVDRWWPQGTWAVGTALYTGAALAGASRMYHNRHWASDVVVGAAIGTFAGLKVVRWHHSRPNNAIDRFFLGGSVVKTPAGNTTIRFSILPAL